MVALCLLLTTGCAPKDTTVEETLPTQTEPPRTAKTGIQTLLVTCLESAEAPQDSATYRNDSCADFLMVMVIDEVAGKTIGLQLNPDTMVSFTEPGASEAVQIPLGTVYSYGSGGSDSFLYGSKAISNLLDGVSIDHYLTFTVDAIGIVNDMLGGVTVQDESENSANVTLMGDDAVSYFQFRDDDDTSNKSRMARQSLFIAKMFSKFIKSSQQDEFLTKLTLALGEGMATDLTLTQMTQMLQSLDDYALDEEILTVPGTAERVNGQFQFQIDEEALKNTVDSLFYEN